MRTLKSVNTIGIIGLGLMGGSFALALKKKIPRLTFIGYARSRQSYEKLCKLHIVDRVTRDIRDVVKDADLVILAVPIYAVVGYFKKISRFLKKGAIVFDVGSSKYFIEKSARCLLPKGVSFVGCHPLCGGSESGAQFSTPDLYKGARCFITSSPRTSASRFIKGLWEQLGCKVIFISARQHDKMLSCLSHFVHLLSFSLTHCIPPQYLKFAPPSLKDLTRISDSPSSVWTDIFLSNKKDILDDMNKFMKILQSLRKIIKEGDGKKLANFIEKVNVKSALIHADNSLK
ncbi:MAG: prephenate dehydrogenase [Candidatus Omnitrophota bacterium]|nr:MAG: prephenate dehydrogenase [Candidatus Omnitrophota bacterium]